MEQLAFAFWRRWRIWLPIILVVYTSSVRICHLRRTNELYQRYAPTGRNSFSKMTADGAQEILKTLAELEFPTLYGLFMVVAIFRV